MKTSSLLTFCSALALSAVTAAGVGSTTEVESIRGVPVTPTSPTRYALTKLTKRLCVFGFCIGIDTTSDPNNCGSIGNNCAWKSWANMAFQGFVCQNSVCAPAACQSLYIWNWGSQQCQGVGYDVNNCGALGNVCKLGNFVGAATVGCNAGSCVAATCAATYTPSAGGTCTKVIDTQSDSNNCGRLGNQCLSSYPGGTGSTCSAGLCRAATCNSGTTWNPNTMQCQNIASDVNNCGVIGKVCSYASGNAQCQNGVCSLASCIANFYLINNACVSINLATDTNNCGYIGNYCNFAYGAGSCINGKCVLSSCNANYAKVTDNSGSTFCQWVNVQYDPNNCGTAGRVCPTIANSASTYCSGGVCGSTCNSGFAWDSRNAYCRPTSNDVNNCGSLGNVCKVTNGLPACSNGVCSVASCNYGFSNINNVCTAINTQTDVKNCGWVGNTCASSYTGGTGSTCVAGLCRAASCNSGTTWNANSMICQNIASDILNCGSIGSICSYPSGVAKCTNGVCSLASCVSGAYQVNGVCTPLDLTRDSNNCGAVGKVCSFPNGVGACISSTCTFSSCTGNYALTTTSAGQSCVAVNTQTDVKNCGSMGYVCQTPSNSASVFCASGKCAASCNAGYAWDSSASYCRPTSNDVNNCGSIGKVCSIANGTPACTNGVCSLLSCNYGFSNINNVCAAINTQTDVKNCGWVGNACAASYPGGTGGACVAGLCRAATCNSGTTWNGNSMTCQNTDSDINNCGSLGNICSYPSGVAKCTNGVCSLASCVTGFYLVNNVCTALNLNTDANNCGAVGNVCTFTNGVGSCVSGKCTFSSCTGNYALTTAAGTTSCVAVNIQTDVNNCGSVGYKCPTLVNSVSTTCSAGKCVSTCSTGYAWDSSASYCRPTSNDVNNCGSIGKVCSIANGTPACTNGVCSLLSCNYGFSNINNVCAAINTQTDVKNCGWVGNACAASYPGGTGSACVAGLCRAATCNSGTTWNGNSMTCQNTDSDINNCGSLGNVCSFPLGVAKCQAGACVLASCTAGAYMVSGVCTALNLNSDPNNCGTVGKVCQFGNGAGSCVSGQCTLSSCSAGYALTTTSAGSSCVQVNTQTDVNNCGSVGFICPPVTNSASTACSAGKCVNTCSTGYAWDSSASYCRPTSNDVNNCGSIGKVCSIANGTPACTNGVCSLLSCNYGFSNINNVCAAINTQTDVKNCGWVGNACAASYPGGTGSACVAGLCRAATCNSGTTWNANSMTCQNTATDINNCGAIGNMCLYPSGVAKCTNGVCSLASCAANFYIINGACVYLNLDWDNNNCGAVGNVCSFPNGAGACMSGKCTYSSCTGNYALTTTSSGTSCTSVNIQTDVNNCGSVGYKCPAVTNSATTVCSAGKCSSTCKTGFSWDSTASYCRPVSSDVNNCGAIGKVCTIANGTPTCSNGVCSLLSCNLGYQSVNGACAAVNTQTDINNCGALGNVCQSSYPGGSGSVCVAGLCRAASCNSGTTWNAVSMTCQNTNSDILNCGALGNVCSFPLGVAKCQSGSCVLASCTTGAYMVNGTCTVVDLTSDINNCGSIGNVCSFPNGVGLCVASQCKLTSCNSGFAMTTTGASVFSSGTTTCAAVDTQTDVNNCGSVGTKCVAGPNAASTSCVAGKCQSTCVAGFGWDPTTSVCRSTTNDVNNCGSIGTVCSIPNGTPACVAGSCVPLSCNSGYYNVNGTCTQLDFKTDINNCGTLGNVCPTSFLFGTGVTCVNGVCQPSSCNSGYDWDALHLFCRDVRTDVNNCGKSGNVCSVPNGVAQCVASQCSVKSCNSGFQNVNGVCTSMNLNTDVNNCGAVGNVCAFPNGQGTCTNGKCTYTSCNGNYTLANNVCTKVDTTSDVNNCGSIGNVCQPVANGGTPFCANSVCQVKCNTGFAFDLTLGRCRDITSDVNNCGAIGTVCLTQLVGSATVTCANSQCFASTCQSGYTKTAGVCMAIDLRSDPLNCGTMGHVCTFTPTGAMGSCVAGVCTLTSCPAGYSMVSNACVLNASQRPNAKRSKMEKPKTLCPEHETACPIVGATSYAMAVSQHFSSFADLATGGIMSGNGGYECLDTKQALDSCGGCASTGEGQDCTKIRGAVGVGCDEGTCVVFSCQSGWKPNAAGSKCIRSQPVHRQVNSSGPTVTRRQGHGRPAHGHAHTHAHAHAHAHVRSRGQA
ncbi:BQ2448_5510 [Microbotryum intermedium]|uniref:BQ2448_5510 protein n=1 Tax=Microbotryum intermedium TaxID=269621 RepID=A0A238F5A3_9BASI|nr:BQ2448_5510 [Microbotryum intermedium]